MISLREKRQVTGRKIDICSTYLDKRLISININNSFKLTVIKIINRHFTRKSTYMANA